MSLWPKIGIGCVGAIFLFILLLVIVGIFVDAPERQEEQVETVEAVQNEQTTHEDHVAGALNVEPEHVSKTIGLLEGLTSRNESEVIAKTDKATIQGIRRLYAPNAIAAEQYKGRSFLIGASVVTLFPV
jgi:hypothetical protein